MKLPSAHADEAKEGNGEFPGEMAASPQGDRGGDVGKRWDNESVRKEGSQTLKGWKDVEEEERKKEETDSNGGEGGDVSRMVIDGRGEGASRSESGEARGEGGVQINAFRDQEDEKGGDGVFGVAASSTSPTGDGGEGRTREEGTGKEGDEEALDAGGGEEDAPAGSMPSTGDGEKGGDGRKSSVSTKMIEKGAAGAGVVANFGQDFDESLAAVSKNAIMDSRIQQQRGESDEGVQEERAVEKGEGENGDVNAANGAEGGQDVEQVNSFGISASRSNDEADAKNSATEPFSGHERKGATEEGANLDGDGGLEVGEVEEEEGKLRGGTVTEGQVLEMGTAGSDLVMVQGLANRVPVDEQREDVEGKDGNGREGENERDRAGDASQDRTVEGRGSSVGADPNEGNAEVAAAVVAEGEKQAEDGIGDGDGVMGVGEGSKAEESIRSKEDEGGSGEGLGRQGDGAITDGGMLEDQPRGEGGPAVVVFALSDRGAVDKREQVETDEAGDEGKEATSGTGVGDEENRKPGGVSGVKGEGDEVEVEGEGEKREQQVPEVKGKDVAEGQGFVGLEGVTKGGGTIGGYIKDVAPNGAVQGAMECSMISQGEGADNIPNIATWKVVPG